VRYILVKRIDDVTDFVRKCGLECPENDGLRRELLADGAPVPKRLRLLREFRVNREGKSEPFARLFEVLPAQ
jgi:hypothetical protein